MLTNYTYITLKTFSDSILVMVVKTGHQKEALYWCWKVI